MYDISVAVVLGTSIAVVAASNADRRNDNAEAIPLNTIWAFRMPGTIDLEKVEKMPEAKEIESIRRALSTPPPQRKEAKPTFVVLGSGLTALHEAHRVLVDGKQPREDIPKNSDASIV